MLHNLNLEQSQGYGSLKGGGGGQVSATGPDDTIHLAGQKFLQRAQQHGQMPSKAPLIAFDTETGHLDPAKGPLLSLAAVAYDDAFHVLILPPRQWWRLGKRQRCDPAAIAVNGYTEREWKKRGAVELPEARRRFAAWLAKFEKPTALAHHAGFDRAWIVKKMGAAASAINRRWECSCAAMAFAIRAGVVEAQSASLDSLCAVAGLTRVEPHDALSDAQACWDGYHWLLGQIAKKRGTHV